MSALRSSTTILHPSFLRDGKTHQIVLYCEKSFLVYFVFCHLRNGSLKKSRRIRLFEALSKLKGLLRWLVTKTKGFFMYTCDICYTHVGKMVPTLISISKMKKPYLGPLILFLLLLYNSTVYVKRGVYLLAQQQDPFNSWMTQVLCKFNITWLQASVIRCCLVFPQKPLIRLWMEFSTWRIFWLCTSTLIQFSGIEVIDEALTTHEVYNDVWARLWR